MFLRGVLRLPLTLYLSLSLRNARVIIFFKLAGVFKDRRERLDLLVESSNGVLS